MTRREILILAVLGVLDLCVICTGLLVVTSPPAAPASTVAAAVLATSTPVPTATPTATPIPATATLVIPPNPVLDLIKSAFEKTDAASSFRMQMDATASGSLAAGLGATNTVTLLSMTGESAGADSHFVLRGLAMARLITDSVQSIEISHVSGKSYVKGPLPILGAKDSKWYVLPPGQTPVEESAAGIYSLFGMNASPVFSKGVQEKIDNRVCDVYAGDRESALSAFANLGGVSKLSSTDAARLQSAVAAVELKVWICDDGYVHQVRIGFDAADPAAKSNQRSSFRMLVHIYDFGGKIAIAAPANAVPATPLIDLNPRPTATPTRQPTTALPGSTPPAPFSAPSPFPTIFIPIVPASPPAPAPSRAPIGPS